MDNVKIKNYRSLKNIELEMGGINVIFGDSDSGKTNFFRALRDFAFNTRGIDFVTHGEKSSMVSIDNKVKWEKGKGINKYTVGKKPFTNVGQSCPEEASDVHGLKEIDFGQKVVKRLNFIDQFESHFIVSQSEQDSAKIVTSLIPGINMILEGSRQAVLKLRHLKQDQDMLEKQKAELDIDLEPLPRLTNIREKATEIDKKLVQIQSKRKRLRQLRAIRELLKRHREDSIRIKTLIVSLGKYIIDAASIIGKARQLSSIIEAKKKSDQLAEEFQFTGGVIGGLALVLENFETLNKQIEHFSRLQSISANLTKGRQRQIFLKKELNDCTESLEAKIGAVSELVQKQGICPLTKKPFIDVCKKYLVEDMGL